ncbi:MAG: alpha-amylase family glycosyl hydrolase [Anaeromyxobacter sp.]
MSQPPQPAWLATVHHDGSPRYLTQLHPALGETVTVRLRIGADAPVRRVLLRTSPDGEQSFHALTPGPARGPFRWWHGPLQVLEPAVHYRFLLEADDGVWSYGAGGPSAHEPLDAADFRVLADHPPPGWLRGAVFYQIFPDRFANGDPSTDPRPADYEYRGARPRTFPWESTPPEDQPFALTFFGGDLPGVIRHLDHLEDLGVNAVYLNPVFTSPSNHKYDVTDFEHVDPHLGGDAALARLRQALDARGMRYLLDLVPNHVGYGHPWFQAARADPGCAEAEFFTFDRHPDDYVTWLGVWSLPKLNYRSEELRRRMITGPDAVLTRWLRPPYAADGWRVDVANMLGRQGAVQLGAEIARSVRQAVKSTRADAYLLGEHFFDASAALQGDQWDGIMNYAGFTFPLWHWLRGYRQTAFRVGTISSPAATPTSALEAAWRHRRAAVPWALTLQQYNALGSHDVSRIRSTLSGRGALQQLALVVQFTYPGLPSIYYGDEIGMQDVPRLEQRGCMIWDPARWDHDLLRLHRTLIALRRGNPALQEGGFQALAVEEDTIAYQREGAEGRVLVVAHRGARPRPAGPLPVAHGGLPDGLELTELFSGARAVVRGGALPLPEQAQGASVWIAERDGVRLDG